MSDWFVESGSYLLSLGLLLLLGIRLLQMGLRPETVQSAPGDEDEDTKEAPPRKPAMWLRAVVLLIGVAFCVPPFYAAWIIRGYYHEAASANELRNMKAAVRTTSLAPGWLAPRLTETAAAIFRRVDRVVLNYPVDDEDLRLLPDFPMLVTVYVRSENVTDAGMVSLRQCTSVSGLDLARTRVTDAGMANLLNLRDLEWLVLDETQVTDAGLVPLLQLHNLRVLSLQGTAVTDDGLAALESHPRLRSLSLSNTQCTAAGVKQLNRRSWLNGLYLRSTATRDEDILELLSCTRLRWLQLSDTLITDAAADAIVQLPSLNRLWLNDTAITDAMLKKLSEKQRLVLLDVSRTKITDAGLVDIAALPVLEVLNLNGCDITDAGLAALASARSLKRLHVADTAITLEASQRLERALPQVVIVRSARTPVELPDTPVPDIHSHSTPLLP